MKNIEQALLRGLFYLFFFTFGSEGAGNAGINKRQYEILCKIYNIAANPPNELYDSKSVEKIRDEIDMINVSLSDSTWFSEIEKSTGQPDPSPEDKGKETEISKYRKRWRTAVQKIAETSAKYTKISLTGTPARIVQLKMKKIEDQMERILERLRQANKEAKVTEIRTKFAEAIGEDGATDKRFGISGARGTACGDAAGSNGSVGNPGKAGSVLIVDFMCLCAKEAGTCSGSASAACGKECLISGETSQAWAKGNLASDLNNVWDKLKQGCAEYRTFKNATSSEGEAAIAAFKNELKGALQTSDKNTPKVGRLGACDSACSGGCTGDISSGNTGICAAYGAVENQWDTAIKWLQNMNSGLAQLKIAETKVVAIQHDIAHLKMLQGRAEEIYEEAKTALENEKGSPIRSTPNQNSSQSQIPGSPSDKTTAQEPTAVSATSIKRFVLSWTLLI